MSTASRMSLIRGILSRRDGTPEYRAWIDMRSRCRNPNNPSFADYGGRGISVCGEWGSFECFLDDLGPRPSNRHSLERRDNSLGYSPANCAWATRDEQGNNTRRNILLTHEGRTQTLTQWATETGIHKRTLLKRFNSGWTVADMLTRPVDPIKNTHGGKAA